MGVLIRKVRAIHFDADKSDFRLKTLRKGGANRHGRLVIAFWKKALWGNCGFREKGNLFRLTAFFREKVFFRQKLRF